MLPLPSDLHTNSQMFLCEQGVDTIGRPFLAYGNGWCIEGAAFATFPVHLMNRYSSGSEEEE